MGKDDGQAIVTAAAALISNPCPCTRKHVLGALWPMPDGIWRDV